MKLKYLLVIPILLLLCGSVESRHIVGGDITVQRIPAPIGSTATPRYQVVITMYRDCNQEGIADPTNFDANPLIGIHRKVNGTWQFWESQNVQREFVSGQEVITEEDPCVEIPPSLCVDFNQYIFIVELPVYGDSYLISYQRCCRNNTVSNIVDPGGTGIAFTFELTAKAQELGNSSPVFKNFPPILICVNRAFFFDHSATDEDGDELFYEFCNPLAAGGDNTTSPQLCTGTTPNPANCLPPYDKVTFLQGSNFSAQNPIPGTVDFSIDPNTGRITGTPDVQGQYVVGVCVKEFRDGNLLSTVRRDIQLNVSLCNFPEARIQGEIDAGNRYVITSCGEATIDFVNESPAEFAQNGYYWEFDVNGETISSNERDVRITFPDVGDYQGFMVVNPNTECEDRAEINTRILPAVEADFSFDYDSCVAGIVEFDGRSSATGADFIQSYDWAFGDDSLGLEEQTTHLYATPGKKDVTLTVTDNNNCMDVLQKTIDYSPVPQTIVVEPNTFRGCLPANVFFNNLSMPIDSTYFIEWDFGDGNTSNDIKPTHTYENVGVYSVSVKIVSPLNCEVERTFGNWIRVEESPTAGFSFSPPFPSVFDRSVQFTDESLDAISWEWDFSGEGSAFEPDPNYTFPDTGFQKIDLIVRHVSGCTDTATQIIDIRPESNFFMPNAFTPNTDATNDEFKGIGFIDGISDFKMSIWGRWGEQVFETNDPLEGWNGRKDNVGDELPNGVYVYLVTYNDPRNKAQKLKGFATLIR